MLISAEGGGDFCQDTTFLPSRNLQKVVSEDRSPIGNSLRGKQGACSKWDGGGVKMGKIHFKSTTNPVHYLQSLSTQVDEEKKK